jgi:hypothetical protein
LEQRPQRPGFLLPFGHRHSLLGHPVPARDFSSPYGRPTGVRHYGQRTGPGRGSHVPHAQDPAGVGCPLYPGDNGVLTVVVVSATVACRISAALSLSAHHRIPTRAVQVTRHHRGFPCSHPMPSLLLACRPWTVQGPLGFPASSAPSRYRPRTSRWRQVSDTDPGHAVDIIRPPADVPTCHVRPRVATQVLTIHPSDYRRSRPSQCLQNVTHGTGGHPGGSSEAVSTYKDPIDRQHALPRGDE